MELFTEGFAGEDVRRLRLERGWRRETLADKTGLSLLTIGQAERGKPVQLSTLRLLEAVLKHNPGS